MFRIFSTGHGPVGFHGVARLERSWELYGNTVQLKAKRQSGEAVDGEHTVMIRLTFRSFSIFQSRVEMLVNPTVKLVQLLPVDSPISLPQSGSECPCSGLVRFGEGDRWVGKLSLKGSC